ncbi:MAG: hypothetical protein PHR38_02535 [Bacteroidales bacterium]|nr:hypothetical protein [Bacteroidales bacterium]MDD4713079.1 hypothetical protein [Bacteroidales bacterium]
MEVTLGYFKDGIEDIPEYINLYNSIYAKKYPKHPDTEQMKIKIESFTSIKVGGSYIDFVAPNFTGQPVRLSEQIKGKIWEKYGVGNGGGATFLVDKNGIILAMSPTDEEVKVIQSLPTHTKHMKFEGITALRQFFIAKGATKE